MKAKLVRIGNSRGIRLPKTIIAQYRFSDEIEIEARPDGLVLRPAQAVRVGWDAAFRRMRERGDDRLLLPEATQASGWDAREWTW
ncbi:MAG: AbrB/MazE/SpoVT family DNA-binding domain-containing protein [Tepidisphaeraceae bacterium]